MKNMEGGSLENVGAKISANVEVQQKNYERLQEIRAKLKQKGLSRREKEDLFEEASILEQTVEQGENIIRESLTTPEERKRAA